MMQLSGFSKSLGLEIPISELNLIRRWVMDPNEMDLVEHQIELAEQYRNQCDYAQVFVDSLTAEDLRLLEAMLIGV